MSSLEEFTSNFINNENNLNNSNSNGVTTNSNTEHRYLTPMLLLAIIFLATSYYFYVNNSDKQKDENFGKRRIKKKIVYSFIIEGLHLIYTILVLNKKEEDLVSFLNIVFFNFSNLYFQSILFDMCLSLIEKYNFLRYKKRDYFLLENFTYFKGFYFILFVAITIFFSIFGTCFYYNSILMIFNGSLGIMIGVLTLNFGIKLGNFIYNKQKSNSFREMFYGNIKEGEIGKSYSSILFLSLFIGIIYLIKGIMLFIFGTIPNIFIQLINTNFFDLLCELISIYFVGIVIYYYSNSFSLVTTINGVKIQSFLEDTENYSASEPLLTTYLSEGKIKNNDNKDST